MAAVAGARVPWSSPDVPVLPKPPEWVSGGLCAQTDPEVFFPELGESAAAAKRVCAACPVRAECLEDALTRGERHGVWGGATVNERRAILRSRRLAARGRTEVAA